MTQCNLSHKQYIGETKRRLKDRFNENRRPADKQTNSSKSTTASEIFLCNSHNATDMQLIISIIAFYVQVIYTTYSRREVETPRKTWRRTEKEERRQVGWNDWIITRAIGS